MTTENRLYSHHPSFNFWSNLNIKVLYWPPGSPLALITFKTNLKKLLLVTFFKNVSRSCFTYYTIVLYYTLQSNGSRLKIFEQTWVHIDPCTFLCNLGTENIEIFKLWAKPLFRFWEPILDLSKQHTILGLISKKVCK